MPKPYPPLRPPSEDEAVEEVRRVTRFQRLAVGLLEDARTNLIGLVGRELDSISRESLEQAARECERLADKWGDADTVAPDVIAHECANAIRSLASR